MLRSIFVSFFHFMANRVLLCLVFFLCCVGVETTYAQTGKLSGKVTEKANKAPIPGVNVVVKLNGSVKGFSTTDEKGFYSVSPLVPGAYSVEFINMAFNTVRLSNVPVEVDKTRFLNAELVDASGIELEQTTVTAYKVPVIDPDNTTTGGTLDNKQIMQSPTREIGTLVSTQPGVFAGDDGAAVNLKGTRSSGVVYFVNGVKQLGGAPNLPTSAISQLTVVTGGVPAQYGDAVGGIINITTTSPSNKFSGGIEAETSAPLDKYDNNLVNFNLAGPIIRRKAADGGESPGALLGFFVSGQYQGSQDDAPLYNGLYQVKADKLAEINARPFTVYSDQQNPRPSPQLSAGLLRLSDLEKVKVRPNADSRRLSYNGTFDFQPVDNILVSFGGSYDQYRQDQYTANNSLFNSVNNPRRFTTNWNTFARFSQNFPSKGENDGLIKNAYYQVQGDFTRFDRVIQNEQYKDNLARYGYIGRIRENPLFYAGQLVGTQLEDSVDVNGVRLPVYTRDANSQSLTFTPSGDNPIPAATLSQLLNDEELGQLVNLSSTQSFASGFLNGAGSQNIQSAFNSLAGPANQYLLQKNDQYRLSALGAADIGKHTVKVGFEFEQRVESFFTAAPNALWARARGLMNFHLERPFPFDADATGRYTVENIDGRDAYVFNVLANQTALAETNYSKLVRARLGVGTREWVNVDDAINPDNLLLSDFTADELAVQGGVVNYQGYSYLGKRAVSSRPAFSDFFRDTQNRPQDAYRPNYAAAFIEDKFAIEDMILRVGLRIDRFDANQQVLKDKYSLVNLTRVGDLSPERLRGFNNNTFELPSTIGEDFAIFVSEDVRNVNFNGDNTGSFTVTGFRNGDVFYSPEGLVIEDLNTIRGADGQFNPLFNTPAQGSTTAGSGLEYLRDRGISLRAFGDYKPQINVMPRVSFSFPISEDALFFAHYDILTQRPENNPTRPLDYYLLSGSVGGSDENTINNPDLKPQRKIDMQLGFQQRLTQSSGLTVSAFYSELRDLIQARSFLAAYPTSYTTFVNFDFGTVKGMTLEYDLRRTKNVSLNASYTLQFAKGTASSATQSANFVNQGLPNLRVPIPLDYDQRHQFKGSMDFRFADGEGPVAFGQRFLQNAGLNVLVQGGSGTPYTEQVNVTRVVASGVQQTAQQRGNTNAARLPGNARVALRLEKDFSLKMGNKQLPVLKTLNVYFRVQNLFNSGNVLNVFRYTGSADDDGYLASSLNPANVGLETPLIQAQNDLYRAKLLTATNYSLPRRMYIGTVLTF